MLVEVGGFPCRFQHINGIAITLTMFTFKTYVEVQGVKAPKISAPGKKLKCPQWKRYLS